MTAMLTPEQRAALEDLRHDLRSLTWTKRYFGHSVEEATVERKQVGRWLDALQSLLDGSDEKGGGGPAHVSLRDSRPDREIAGESRGLPVAGADTAPPDSPASEESDAKIAARVEALGLEPSEREVVRKVIDSLGVLGSRLAYSATMSPFQYHTQEVFSAAIAALAPIAEERK